MLERVWCCIDRITIEYVNNLSVQSGSTRKPCLYVRRIPWRSANRSVANSGVARAKNRNGGFCSNYRESRRKLKKLVVMLREPQNSCLQPVLELGTSGQDMNCISHRNRLRVCITRTKLLTIKENMTVMGNGAGFKIQVYFHTCSEISPILLRL